MFYGGATQLYNSVNATLGAALTGTAAGTQPIASFMSPTDSTKYFVVTSSASDATFGQLYWHKVDMTANNGLGNVTTINQTLGTTVSASEAVLAVPNNDGTKVWAITYKPNTPQYIAYLFDENGYTGTSVTSNALSNNVNHSNGTLRLSPDGKSILSLSALASGGTGILREFTFDASSGYLTEKWNMPITNSPLIGTMAYGTDYSPNGTYAYVSGQGGTAKVFRYDISSSTSATILASRLDVTATTNLGTGGGQIQRGPDGKMYVANTGATSLATITTPDGTPTFTLAGQPLASGKTSTVGLPQTVGNCTKGFPDTDNDGIMDLLDIDDDNDGVLDIVEVCTYQQQSKTGVTISTTVAINGAVTLLLDGTDNVNQAYFGTTAIANQDVFKFVLPTAKVLNMIEMGM